MRCNYRDLECVKEVVRWGRLRRPYTLEWGDGSLAVNIGIVRKIDDLGRIVVPAETRRLFSIHEGDELAIAVENDAIVIRKLEAVCVFCGSTDEVGGFRGRGLCARCRDEINN